MARRTTVPATTAVPRTTAAPRRGETTAVKAARGEHPRREHADQREPDDPPSTLALSAHERMLPPRPRHQVVMYDHG
jgi:hypothetical protein